MLRYLRRTCCSNGRIIEFLCPLSIHRCLLEFLSQRNKGTSLHSLSSFMQVWPSFTCCSLTLMHGSTKIQAVVTCGNRNHTTLNVLSRRCYHKYNNYRKWTDGGGYKICLMSGAVLVSAVLYQLNNSKISATEAEIGSHPMAHPSLYVKLHSQIGSTEDNQCRQQDVQKSSLTLQEAITISRDLVQRIKDETGSPGLVVAVSVDGQTVWAEGIGYSDVENRIPCQPETVFRIASISKSVTMATVARLWENGELDLDKPIQCYLPDFPEKTWNGEKVTITTRQLLSHLSGIRHYSKEYIKQQQKEHKIEKSDSLEFSDSSKGTVPQPSTHNSSQSKNINDASINEIEMQMVEYYIKDKYSSVTESVKIFKDDPLVNKPGTKFLYTTHGWTLVSAVVEKAAKMPFDKCLKKLLDELGMENTYLEENGPLIYNRGRHYIQDKSGRLVNAPYVDLSYKWAGGGLVSTVLDLTKFGNAMLYSYQTNSYLVGHLNAADTSKKLPGFLKPETMKMMWTPLDKTEVSWGNIAMGGYGLGWGVWKARHEYAYCKDQKFFVSHTGGAIGASSVLLILPHNSEKSVVDQSQNSQEFVGNDAPAKGVVVSIIVNLMSVGLNKTAFDIANLFQNVNMSCRCNKIIP